MDCTICLEPVSPTDNDTTQLECCKAALFHSKCIKEWVEASNTCPLCREMVIDRCEICLKCNTGLVRCPACNKVRMCSSCYSPFGRLNMCVFCYMDIPRQNREYTTINLLSDLFGATICYAITMVVMICLVFAVLCIMELTLWAWLHFGLGPVTLLIARTALISTVVTILIIALADLWETTTAARRVL